ncbi:hypothetical protein [Streptosporangium sp. NPDC002721]|uniref:hypothetical protein n=1 Tax=Streptosporangium sp. NPDC002721 TaxID=3366188 RepID=UPI0036960CCB
MKVIRGAAGALALGAGFGTATSLVKEVSYGMAGSPLVDVGWAWVVKVAEVASLLLDVGWAWAALAVAVAVGWLVGACTRGAVAGVLALIVATVAYYCVESALGGQPLAWQWRVMLHWWLASLLFGPVLGAVGAVIRHPGVIGLLARLYEVDLILHRRRPETVAAMLTEAGFMTW